MSLVICLRLIRLQFVVDPPIGLGVDMPVLDAVTNDIYSVKRECERAGSGDSSSSRRDFEVCYCTLSRVITV